MGEQFNLINKIIFKKGDEIEPSKINIIVGPNNCGKSQTLKDLLKIISSKPSEDNVLIDKVKINLPPSWDAMIKMYDFDVVTESTDRYSVKHICSTLNINELVSKQAIRGLNSFNENFIKKNNGDDADLIEESVFNSIGDSLVVFMGTKNRLSLLDEPSNTNLNHNPTGGPEVLAWGIVDDKHPNRSKIICENFNKLFDEEIVYPPSLEGRPHFKFNKENKDVLSQGDGYVAGLGMLAGLEVCKDHPVILLDEPEAFLHSSQAYRFGQMITDLITDNQQIFISTHSSDFLRGIMSVGLQKSKDFKIILLDRSSKDHYTNVLPYSSLKQIFSKPSLSSSGIIDGLFNNRVIMVESEGDESFYRQLLSLLDITDELHFVLGHSHSQFKSIAEIYNQFNKKYAIITDCDKFINGSDNNSIETAKKGFLALAKTVISDSRKFKTIEDKTNSFYKAVKCLHNSDIDKFTTDFKSRGISSLSGQQLDDFKSINTICKEFGLFLVPVGELESWTTELGVNPATKRKKTEWVVDALDALNTKAKLASCPELKKFGNEIKKYII